MVAHPGPPQIRARAINAHGSSFQPSRPAIRCCFVDTSTGSDAPAMFPSNGQLKRRPLHSAGSFGQVPPPQRYYGTLRLPAAHLAALRFLRLAIPSFVPCSSPPARDRAVDQPGVGKPGLQAGSHDGDGRVSQVPERPSCPCACSWTPVGPKYARPLRRLGTAPACVNNGGSREQKISGLDRTALGLAVYASQWRSPATTQDSLPAAGQALPGGIR